MWHCCGFSVWQVQYIFLWGHQPFSRTLFTPLCQMGPMSSFTTSFQCPSSAHAGRRVESLRGSGLCQWQLYVDVNLSFNGQCVYKYNALVYHRKILLCIGFLLSNNGKERQCDSPKSQSYTTFTGWQKLAVADLTQDYDLSNLAPADVIDTDAFWSVLAAMY